MINRLVFGSVLLYLASMFGDTFTDKLTSKKPLVDRSYYQLLPEVDEKRPDLWCMRSRDPQSMSLEHEYLAMIADACLATTFIETGSFEGDTTHKAEQHFLHIETIELDKKLYEKVKKRFKNNKKIKAHQGDSARVLSTILKLLHEKAVIFLDAHFSMGKTAKGNVNTPLVAELEVIKKSDVTDAILIIDDIRMFYTPLHDAQGTFIEGYPTLNEIVEKIREVNPNYQCAVIYDTLVAFPAHEKITVSPMVHALTMSRLYDGTNYDIEDVLQAELTIAKAPDKEREVIIDLAQRWIEKWSESAGLSRHYALWLGLILLAYEQYDKALIALQEAHKRGLSDWRVGWYCALAKAELFFGIR